MFQRYLNNYNLHLFATVYTWDEDRASKLHDEELKPSYDFYRQEWVEENKKHKVMKDIGLLPSYWDYIGVNYISLDIFDKYNVHL